MGDVIIGGRKYWVLGPVRPWTESGLEVVRGHGARKRTQKIDLVVWHWTGGEGGAEQVYRVLHRRELGVEFCIDHSGVIWQFCDPALVDTFDAGVVNRRSVGVEIANYGSRAPEDTVPSRGAERPRYTTILNGRARTFAHFWSGQIAAALSLADALSRALEIPRQVPRGMKGFVEPNTLPRERLVAFSGHLGHFHVSTQKIDPGLDLLEALRCAWTDEI